MGFLNTPDTTTQTSWSTCQLDDTGNPVDFTGEDGVGVQDLQLHPHGDVLPLHTQRSLEGTVTFECQSVV